MTRLSDQMEFLLTCDRLKSVARTTYLHDGTRPENSAEHSWHLALMALTLGEYAPAGPDLNRVVRLLLVHDLVEVYAGDTHFDAAPARLAGQHATEAQAAARLFGSLPANQAEAFHALWNEFEAHVTPEARFAKALDALAPMLLTWGEGGLGCAGRYPELSAERVLKLKESALQGFPALWDYAQALIGRATADGLFSAPVSLG
jgi:putative hydrolases of HD superfamily